MVPVKGTGAFRARVSPTTSQASCGGEIRSTNVMRDHLNNLLQLVFHTGLPLFLVVVLLILNALLSQSGALVR
jgi:hypothetical protein